MAFDVDRYARESQALRWEDLDLDSFQADPLSPDTLVVRGRRRQDGVRPWTVPARRA